MAPGLTTSSSTMLVASGTLTLLYPLTVLSALWLLPMAAPKLMSMHPAELRSHHGVSRTVFTPMILTRLHLSQMISTGPWKISGIAIFARPGVLQAHKIPNSLPYNLLSHGIRFAITPCPIKVLITDGELFKPTIPSTTTSLFMIAILKKFSSRIIKLLKTLTMFVQLLPILKLTNGLKVLPL